MGDLLLNTNTHSVDLLLTVINLHYDGISTSETVFLELPTSLRVDFSSFHLIPCAVPYI